jgi:hypothetical protein
MGELRRTKTLVWAALLALLVALAGCEHSLPPPPAGETTAPETKPKKTYQDLIVWLAGGL